MRHHQLVSEQNDEKFTTTVIFGTLRYEINVNRDSILYMMGLSEGPDQEDSAPALCDFTEMYQEEIQLISRLSDMGCDKYFDRNISREKYKNIHECVKYIKSPTRNIASVEALVRILHGAAFTCTKIDMPPIVKYIGDAGANWAEYLAPFVIEDKTIFEMFLTVMDINAICELVNGKFIMYCSHLDDIPKEKYASSIYGVNSARLKNVNDIETLTRFRSTLTSLDVSGSDVTSSELKQFSSLTSIDVSNCPNITSIPIELSSLRKLIAHGTCGLKDSAMRLAGSLEHIDASNNTRISNLSPLYSTLTVLIRPVSMNLRSIASSTASSFSSSPPSSSSPPHPPPLLLTALMMQNLVRVNISGSAVNIRECVTQSTPSFGSALIELNVKNCTGIDASIISRAYCLRKLNISGTGSLMIPTNPTLSVFPRSLEYLDASGTSITNAHVAGLVSLETLCVASCQNITSIGGSAESIVELDISNTRITPYELLRAVNLRKLTISTHSLITDITPFADRLTYLDISFNENFINADIAKMTRLKTLNISYTNITRVHQELDELIVSNDAKIIKTSNGYTIHE